MISARGVDGESYKDLALQRRAAGDELDRLRASLDALEADAVELA